MPPLKEGQIVRFRNSPQCVEMNLVGKHGVVTERRQNYVRVRPNDTRKTTDGFWFHREEVKKVK